jgi:adenylate kinase family enzyme
MAKFNSKNFKNLVVFGANANVERISAEIFGKRVMIFGPSASGKSTVADALAKKLNFPVCHLDQLRFLPHTFWVPRPIEEFRMLHDEVVNSEKWIVDGNYTDLMPSRVARATAAIWLNPPAAVCIFNFYKRFFRKNRRQNPYVGLLDGADEKFTIAPLKYIFRHKLKKRLFVKLMGQFRGQKIFYLNSFEKIRNFCEKIRNM